MRAVRDLKDFKKNEVGKSQQFWKCCCPEQQSFKSCTSVPLEGAATARLSRGLQHNTWIVVDGSYVTIILAAGPYGKNQTNCQMNLGDENYFLNTTRTGD